MARIAALQFATGTDVDSNRATCLRMIDRAQAQAPDLLVLPEFCNHISWYDDAEHAWRVALECDGPFLGAIAQRADLLLDRPWRLSGDLLLHWLQAPGGSVDD